ncbi:Zn-dependent exopeptidases superfamily protein [Perilla frutescens var. hirtella]|nr:Zn-dependent exopeptidases superfamily protein [Perilla frutescens var. hirtella]
MRQRGKGASLKSNSSSSASGETGNQENNGGRGSDVLKDKNVVLIAKRSTYVVFTLFVLVIYGGWGVYHYQFESLPAPLALEQVGKRGFSEHEAMKHVEALTRLGPHPVGSEALESALKYVSEAAEIIQKTAHWEVNVEVDLFHVKSGANNMVGGLFKGKTLVYSDLNHVILRITPKYASEAGERAILVSSHIDTVFAGPGAGDDTSSVAVMLELARGVSQCAQGFKHAVIFLFNTGEEEGLNGAHSFITQHPWSDTVQIAVDLEAMGLGGKSTIFQAGPHPWAVEIFASVAKYPTAQIVAEDVFYSGAINSGTDFEIYKNLGGLSGLDFAYLDKTAVYHTKNDKLDLLKSGSLQHLGENMLAFLLHAAASPSLPESKPVESDLESNQERAIYFDILGTYMITFRQRYATVLYNSVILQSLLLWAASLAMGGYSAAISLALSCLSLVLMWIFSIGFSTVVAFILPKISYSPVPYISNPWLVLCLFGAPALLGAFIGQHVGYIILKSYLARTFIERRYLPANLHTSLAKFDAERWLYKSGLVQWLVLLMLGTYYKIGSSYLALAWLASPAFAYGFLEATLSPTRLPKPLKTATLLIGLSVPFILSSGLVIRLSATIIGYTVRFVRNPGSTPEWLENVVVAIFIAACVCLTLVYLLSYVHISGAKVPLIIATSFLSVVSLLAVWGGVVPPFTEDTARAVNVVHVVDARGVSRVNPKPVSYISMFSVTSGDLIKEADHTGEGFVCGRDRYIDFVTFSVNYSCWTDKSAETGWLNSEVPAIYVAKDTRGENRETQIVIETRISTRWALAINTGEIEDFQMKGTANSSDTDSEELIPLGEKSSVDGWHTIQFSGGRKSPTKFQLSLFWSRNGTQTTSARDELLLRFRADVVDTVTPPVENILRKLPLWCSLYGKSSSPHTVAFLSNLPVSLQVK